MRPARALAFAAAVFACCAAGAQARGPAGFETVYHAPTDVNLGGRPVVADIALHADMNAARGGALRLALTADVTPFVEETERDLENWVASRYERCGQRWDASAPRITFPEGAMRFAIDIGLEIWNCGLDGKGEPGRLTREAGSVDVTLIPYVEDGRLQARLGAFSIGERSGVSKYLPLEFVIRRVLDGELKKLNENPKFFRAPRPLHDEGFRYESIAASRYGAGRVLITARFVADGPATTLDRLARRVAEEGLTQ